jgi:hypothetical protein
MFSLFKVQRALPATYLAESDSCHWTQFQWHELGNANPSL